MVNQEHVHDVSCAFGNPTCPAFADTVNVDALARALAKADGKVWWTRAFPARYIDQARALIADGWQITPPPSGDDAA